MILTFLATVFVLGILIFVHELGHYWAAKLFKIRVDRFSIGLPPRLIGKKIGETDYCISAIPIGGYVKIAGMVDESMDVKFQEGPPQPWEFRSRPWYQKVIVISAGSFMNLLIAFLVLWGVNFFGFNPDPWYEHYIVEKGMPADTAGIMAGDRIVTVNGDSIKGDSIKEEWGNLLVAIAPFADTSLEFLILRGDLTYPRIITPKADTSLFVAMRGDTIISFMSRSEAESADPTLVIKPRGFIGIRRDYIQYDLFWSFQHSWNEYIEIFTRFINFFYELITGKNEKPIKESLGGPIKIAQMAGEAARYSFRALLLFLVGIGINLGLLNLLPFPVLDGGHLVLIHVEAIFRKTIPIKTKLVIQQVGMVILLALIIFVLYNDIF